MYSIISAISLLMRQFLLPNPFEALGDGLTIMLSSTPILLTTIVLNWIAGFALFPISYAITGIYYERGSNGALGSFLYLMFYCIHTFLLWLMSLAGFTTWAIVLILIGYIGCHIGFAFLRNRFNGGFY